MLHFEYSSLIDAPVERVFAFHERPDAIRLLTPALLFPRVKLLKGRGIEAGVERIMTMGFNSRWHARHTEYEENRLFVDVQVAGPMKYWRHAHRFAAEDGKTRLTDSIEFEPPLGFVGALFWRATLSLLFAYRHAVTKRECS